MTTAGAAAAHQHSIPRRVSAALALVLPVLVWPGATLALEAAVLGTPPSAVQGFVLDGDGAVRALTAEGRSLLVGVVDGEIRFRDAGARPTFAPPPPGALPDAEVETGSGEIAATWLIAPTDRDDHGVLGDAIEAAGLRVRFQDGTTAASRLGPEHVFEDRRARIVDTDGDGPDEILVVRSGVAHGAALALYEASGGAIRLRAVSKPIGRPHRWLNPVGVADFDGDGRREIAAIVTPHLAGRLTFYRQDGAALVPLAAREGYSNHAIGSRELGMAAIADVNGDGAADVIVPTRGHREVAVVTFANGQIGELGRLRHTDRVVTDLVVGRVSGIRAAVYGLSDGSVVVVPLPRGG